MPREMRRVLAGVCTGCGACANSCPQNCIVMSDIRSGWYKPVVDSNKCVHCGKCEQVCPMLNGYKPEKDIQKSAFFINGHEYFRGLSSSGGFFYALAQLVLKKNGVVFGAYLDKKNKVVHGFVENEDALFPFLTSKYVQSDTKNIFAMVRDFLSQDRMVLYAGTPCQIGGLLSFLQGEPKNLITCELFCHGVPSPYSWRSYLKDYYGEKTIRYIQFRYKGRGWWQYGLRMQFLHEDYYSPCRSLQDPYLRSFLKNVNLNVSCYNCAFKCDKKNADFTIGDAWNINRVRANMDDDRGVTTVLINSTKAQRYFKIMKQEHHCFEISREDALFVRGELEANKAIPPNRDQFVRDLLEYGFRYAMEHNQI